MSTLAMKYPPMNVTASIRFRLLTACLLTSLCLNTQAAMDQPGREALNQFAANLETLQARFEQRVIRNDGGIENESSGEIWLQKPHFFHWSYGGEFPEQVIADGERIWIYDEVLEQVTVKSQAEFNDDSPLIVLTDIQRLDDLFEVREAGDIEGMVLLELRPTDSESEFDRMLLGLENGQLQLLAMEDAFGMRTEIRFTEVTRNVELTPGLFAFTPPDGVDVIGAEDLIRP